VTGKEGIVARLNNRNSSKVLWKKNYNEACETPERVVSLEIFRS